LVIVILQIKEGLAMKKILFIVFGLVFLLTQSVQALTWVSSPDNNVSGFPETELILGVNDVDSDEWDTQSPGIFGMAANLGGGWISHTVQFTYDLYSWDSYNDMWYGGYGDVVVLALTENKPYWNLPITHPVWDDPQLIWPTGNITAWGGDEWGDNYLDNLLDPGTINVFDVDWTREYYLNIILDTSNGGDMFPSWGYVSQFQIESTPIPEPATLILVGSGLAGIGFWRKRRRS
jgi:hypothetical protein